MHNVRQEVDMGAGQRVSRTRTITQITTK